MTIRDAYGNDVEPEDVLDPQELADYYDARGIDWRRRGEALGRWAS